MISSKDYNPQVGGAQKVLQPGTHYCRIVDMKLSATPYKQGGYDILFVLEGEPVGGDFVGLPIDKNNPALGNYIGPIGTVKSAPWPFSDFTFKGEMIQRDDQIFRWIMTFAKQLGVLDDIINDGLEASTIEDYIADIKKYFVKPGLYAHFTLAGQEYFKEGSTYPNYYLNFPKPAKGFYPYSGIYNEANEAQNFMLFDSEAHITVKTPKADTSPVVESFGGQPMIDVAKMEIGMTDIDNSLAGTLPF